MALALLADFFPVAHCGVVVQNLAVSVQPIELRLERLALLLPVVAHCMPMHFPPNSKAPLRTIPSPMMQYINVIPRAIFHGIPPV